MSDGSDQDILNELRKIRRMFYLVLIFVIISALPAFFMGFSRGITQDSVSWDRVTTAMRKQDFPAALSIARTLVNRQPDYYYGHSYLGAIYLAMGDLTNAEAQYSQAYNLFPNEEGEKNLAAVRKRRAEEGKFKLLPNETGRGVNQ